MPLFVRPRLRSAFALFSLALLVSQGCKTRKFNSGVKSTGGGTDLILPVAPWSGELVVPKVKEGDTWKLDASKRNPDGGVDFVVHNSADPKLKPGQTVHLVWEGLNLRLNVRFSKAVKKLVGTAPNDRKMPAPRLLDGLNDVSPLESLAWHRDPYTTNSDPFEVILKDATYDASANRLVIHSEPVQVSGQSMALLKFTKVEPTGKPHEMKLTAHHFDKSSNSFSGPEITVIAQESSIQPKVGKTEDSIPMTTVKGISENPMNEEGWYSYGTLNPDGTYQLASLEPRSVMRVGATQKYVNGKDAALNFYEKQQWDEAAIVKEKGTVRKTLVEPAGGADFNTAKEAWLKDKGTQRFLVLNLFGWWKWNGQLERDSIVRSGHVALGIAKIITDPFTGEDRFEIEYKQVYGANNEDIAAGSMTWAHYMGNMERGWMYTRPISDVLVRFPQFSRSYQVSTLGMSQPVSPMSILEQKLEFMTASFRVGADKDNDAGGTADGVSIISAANSCSQDSTQAMFMTLEKVLGKRNDLAMGTTLANLDAWAERSGAREEQAADFNKLRNIYKCTSCKEKLDFDNLLFRVWVGDKVRKDWAENLLESEKTQPRLVGRGDFMASLLGGIWSARSIFPRAVHDRYTRIFLENGAGLWNLQTLQIGGTIDGLEPVAPNRPPAFVN